MHVPFPDPSHLEPCPYRRIEELGNGGSSGMESGSNPDLCVHPIRQKNAALIQ